jgi:hypothetical protein
MQLKFVGKPTLMLFMKRYKKSKEQQIKKEGIWETVRRDSAIFC